jgi:hypothetical protein
MTSRVAIEKGERGVWPEEDVATRIHRAFATVGWLAAAGALAGVVLAIMAPDAAQAAALDILVGGSVAVLFVGAPFGRSGRPSRLRIAVLYALALSGLVFTFVLGPLVAIGVVVVAYVIVLVAMARWRPSDWQTIPPLKRIGRIPPGTPATTGGTVVALLAVTEAGYELFQGQGPRFAVVAVAGCAAILSWLWIAFTYAGIGPSSLAQLRARRGRSHGEDAGT